MFKIGGLHQISWFQFLPNESELSSLADKSLKVDQKDAGAQLVLSSHLQLQDESFLSTWTNSFVGPWDPSQGLYNPDEKIKLWLFLPGNHTLVVEKAQPAVSRLRVLASGLWVAPGDSEEVSAAISQALRNSIERAFKGLSYLRFGDVFSRYHPFSQSEELFRKGQPVVEFVFAATEEAIFVHAIVSAKHIRAVSGGDVERASCHSHHDSGFGFPVVVSPHGMLGKLTGCCPSDLVKQVYLSSSKSRASSSVLGLSHHAAHGSSCQLRGQSCFIEVTVGCPLSANDKIMQQNPTWNKPLSRSNVTEPSTLSKLNLKEHPEQSRIFIYPDEAVVVPVMQTSFSRSSLKRFWLQNWIGPSLFGASFFVNWSDFSMDEKSNSNGLRSLHGNHSSSNSNNSSISSISSSSSDSDYKASGAGDFEGDADSLTCRQSGLSSAGQSQSDNVKLGTKRVHSGMSDSVAQAGVVNPSMNEYGSVVDKNPVLGGSNDAFGGQWVWNEEEEGSVVDIQTLLTEFGGFGDFFESDILPFGEPPGTTESQAILFTPQDCADIGSSSGTAMMDVTDSMLLPVGLPSFDIFNQPPPATKEDSIAKVQELTMNSAAPGELSAPAPWNSEFDHVIKAEALMTFAPEYGAIETSSSEITSSIFSSPYIPESRKVESENSSSNNYVYSATPPASPCIDESMQKASPKVSKGVHSGAFRQTMKYYFHIESGAEISNRRLPNCKDVAALHDTVICLSGARSSSIIKPLHSKVNNGPLMAASLLPSLSTVLATQIECLMFQAFMCRTRHTLLSPTSQLSVGLSRASGDANSNQLHSDSSFMSESIPRQSELKKNEMIPVRIAGDVDVGMLDNPLNAPVGVWSTVGHTKGSKSTTPSIDSMPHTSFIEENILSYGLRQPLQEFLDGLGFLVQQATSFVDVALDGDSGDGAYGWLAVEEQGRRGLSCGPSMVHAGCGGILSLCHLVDVAGVELVDPLSADVQPSFAISLLQSDIKAALKSAFGSLDGPLSVTDWCKGHGLPADGSSIGDGFFAESTASASDCRDSSSSITVSVGEPISPSQSSCGGSSCIKDGSRTEETNERRAVQETCGSEGGQQIGSRHRPALSVLPSPAILVGYQDDWLKTSANSLQLWEKAPLEPYATQKHMAYFVICPDIDPLRTAAADFFLQLGTVYEACKLGTHLAQNFGNEMDVDSGKASSSGFVLLECPQSMKMDSRSSSILGSISDYFLSLSNGWDVSSYLKSLSRILKNLNLGSCMTTKGKEGNSGPYTVIYVVCPFPEPLAILRTLIESSIALGSAVLSSDKERRSIMYNQVAKALSHSAAVDEALPNILTISGFTIPKLVLQIVTVDAIFRVTNPPLNELVILKEIAFTVYNKARRTLRGSSSEISQSTSSSGRSHASLIQMVPPMTGIWKDTIGSRISGSSLQRESELDASLRSSTWESSWQTTRIGALYDANRAIDLLQDETRCMFEPLFILAEPGSLEHAISPPVLGNLAAESSKLLADDGTSGNLMLNSALSGNGDTGPGSQSETSVSDSYAAGNQNSLPSLHCCYGWTEDWRWLVSVWTDSRGELLESYVYPFGGISSRQDTKGLQSLFVQVLQQGCQILQGGSPNASKPRDFVITRIGCFFELECLEWQKALYAIGGSEVKKWSLQLRLSVPDVIPPSSNGTSLQQPEISLLHERNLTSASPLYGQHSKSSTFMKSGLGQPSSRKLVMGGVDNSRGLLQWVRSITFVSVSVDHSLQLLFQADFFGSSQSNSSVSQPSYIEGYTPVKSLGSTSSTYVFIPSPSARFLPPYPLQLPTCLTAESPPLAHLLHSRGSAIPLCTAFVVSKAVPSMRRDARSISKEEWPSVLCVSLIDHYGSNKIAREKTVKGNGKLGGRMLSSEARDFGLESHVVLESVAAELQALSWLTASPGYLDRRSALPFHCDTVLRLRRLLYFADKELSRSSQQPE